MSKVSYAEFSPDIMQQAKDISFLRVQAACPGNLFSAVSRDTAVISP